METCQGGGEGWSEGEGWLTGRWDFTAVNHGKKSGVAAGSVYRSVATRRKQDWVELRDLEGVSGRVYLCLFFSE